MHIYAHVCIYFDVMNGICGQIHVELVYILSKQKIFDTIFCLEDAVFHLAEHFYEVFVYYCCKLNIQLFSTKRWNGNKLVGSKILWVFPILKIRKSWHIHYSYHRGDLRCLSVHVTHVCVQWEKLKNKKRAVATLAVVILMVVVSATQAQRSVSLKLSSQFMATISEQLQKIFTSFHE